jgi:S-adenosylmethionine synthetase
VANGYAEECLVSVAYAIGKVEPLMVFAVDQDRQPIDKGLLDAFDFRPAAIIERLGLRQAIFQQTAAYGHFGRTGLPWEEVVIC